MSIINAVRPSLRLPRRLFALLASVAIVGGLFAASPDVAEAQYCGTNDCTLHTREVSSITVVHADPGLTSDVPVEPDTGETIDITAYWDTRVIDNSPCVCAQTASANVTVDVDWSDTTGWSAACTGCNSVTGPIYRVAVCGVGECGSGATIDNGWSYELIVDIKKNHGKCLESGQTIPVDGWLSHVDYDTTSVDDGNLINDSTCTEGASVSPTSQVFSVTDSGGFDCNFTCASAAGPTMTITYQ